MQEALKRAVDSLKTGLDHGRETADQLIVRANKLAEKLHQLGLDVGNDLRQMVREYQGKAKELIHRLSELFRRPKDETAVRSRRSLSDRLSELDEDQAVHRICDPIVRLSLPRHRDVVRERCERHARAVIRRLKSHLNHDSDNEVDANPDSDPEIESELDLAEGPNSEFMSLSNSLVDQKD